MFGIGCMFVDLFDADIHWDLKQNNTTIVLKTKKSFFLNKKRERKSRRVINKIKNFCLKILESAIINTAAAGSSKAGKNAHNTSSYVIVSNAMSTSFLSSFFVHMVLLL